jgi:transposase-like protein
MVKEIIKRYSIAFKKQVVSEYESGASIYELNRRYGITGATTVKNWVEQYGREGLRHKLIMIQQPEEQERVRELEEQVKQLEAMVAQLSLEKFITECALEVAEEDLGYKVKKKSVTESLTKRKKTIRKRK